MTLLFIGTFPSTKVLFMVVGRVPILGLF